VSPFGKFLKKFFLGDILQGLWVTLRYYFSPKVTIQYPEEVQPVPARFKGILRLFRNDQGEALCIACKLCQKICPTDCFDIEGVRPEGSRLMRPAKYDWKLGRCTFCGLCVEVCPTDAIRFSREFRMTSVDKERLFFRLPEMYFEGEELQEKMLGGHRP
jgi:NADH-quinone oxidoreductase subunit I